MNAIETYSTEVQKSRAGTKLLPSKGSFHLGGNSQTEARTNAFQQTKTSDNHGAGDRTRTYDPIITNDVLYQLSYTGQSLAPNSPARDWAGLLAPELNQGKVYLTFSGSLDSAGVSA